MNRVYVLVILLVMFLSCGNSSTENTAGKLFSKPERANVLSNLTKAQKVVAGKLDLFFTEMNKKGIFNGSVLVSRAGKVIYKKSLGILDKSTQDRLTDSSMFQ